MAPANNWIRTFSGRQFHVLAPSPEEVHIDDIAHSLSMQCRFVGHVSSFYSVGEHSVRISRHCPKNPLFGLLHDAAESYLGDLSAPLKHQPQMCEYRDAEWRVMAAVCQKFGLPLDEPQEVKDADRRMLLTEARDLGLDVTGWYTEFTPFDEKIEPWSPKRAEREFLDRFAELTGDRVMANENFRNQADGHHDYEVAHGLS